MPSVPFAWDATAIAQRYWFFLLPREEHPAAPLAFTHALPMWLTVSSFALLECFALTADAVGFFFGSGLAWEPLQP